MSNEIHDVVVVGVGSMGSAACYELASRGYKVLGLEQFDRSPHEYGSHSGQSRIYRRAYFEHPDYVPLLNKALANWKQLEQITGEQVYFKTGLLYCGPRKHETIQGVKKAANLYKIELKSVVREDREHPFSHFKIGKNEEMLFEPEAGFLLPEKVISLYILEAKNKGAEIKTGEKVLEWKKEKGVIKVLTNTQAYYGRKLVITAGAWSEQVIKKLSVPLKVTRQIIVWVKPDESIQFTPANFPCWMIAADDIEGTWYGFPYLSGEKFPGPEGLKFALHYPDKETNPDKVNMDLTDEEVKSLIDKAKKYFTPADSKIVAAKTCLYTNTWDENFIIDHLPGYDGDVTIACGFSGHGFKFVSVVGEILADLSVNGKTELPIDFLGLKRFGGITF